MYTGNKQTETINNKNSNPINNIDSSNSNQNNAKPKKNLLKRICKVLLIISCILGTVSMIGFFLYQKYKYQLTLKPKDYKILKIDIYYTSSAHSSATLKDYDKYYRYHLRYKVKNKIYTTFLDVKINKQNKDKDIGNIGINPWKPKECKLLSYQLVKMH